KDAQTEAVKCLKNFVILYDKCPAAWILLGNYHRAGVKDEAPNIELAFIDYKKALTLEPNNPQTWYLLGICWLSSKRIEDKKIGEEAVKCFLKAIELNNKFVPALVMMGHCYEHAIGLKQNTLQAFAQYMR